MNRKGVCYDAGSVMGFNWRPSFRPEQVRRELQIIKDDLHCNAVRISGQDIVRLVIATEHALNLGLEVWYSPTLWDRTPEDTLRYLVRAAEAAEEVRRQKGGNIVFVAGGELTLFMQGILEGRRFQSRLANPSLMSKVKAGEHNKPLNDFLAKANAAARGIFHGPVTYASLVWERVNWDLFDYVAVDHYRSTKIEDKYIEMLKPSFSYGKPVVITEFGYATTRDGIGGDAGFLSTAGLGGAQIVDTKSQALHYMIPVFGRFIKPRLNGQHTRDEAWQAGKLTETLQILDSAGVDGAFIAQFISQINPCNDDPRYDLDMASSSLVKYFGKGRHGTMYPDMLWEPKESFRAVADYYASH